MRKQLFLCLLSTLVINKVFAQDIHFSQYFVAPQLINPAGFGVLNSFEAGLQYKGQWNSFTDGYTSFAAFANKSFKTKAEVNSKKAYASAGLNVIYDKAGSNPLSHFKAEIPLNVTKQLTNAGFMTAGIYLGYGQLSVKPEDYTWGNQFDGSAYNSGLSSREAALGQTKSYVDAGAGLTFVSLRKGAEATSVQNMFGVSVSHLNRPDVGLAGSSALGMRINVYEYYHFYFKNSPLSIVPSVLFQYQLKAYEVILGANLRRAFKDAVDPKKTKYASIGLFYRLQDMLAVNAMMELNNFSIGVNYDFNVSKLQTSSKSFGGLEISLKLNRPFNYSYKESSKLIDKKL